MLKFREVIEPIIEEYIRFPWDSLRGTNETSEESNSHLFEINLTGKINAFTKDIFQKLVLYIIDGDYLLDEDQPNLKELLNKIEKVYFSVPDEPKIQTILTYSQNILKNWLRLYVSFYNRVNRHIKNPLDDWSFDIYKQDSVLFKFFPEVELYDDYYRALIDLSRLEYNLQVNSSQIGALHILKERVERVDNQNIISTDITHLIIEKIDLLIKKIKLSIEKKGNRFYGINFETYRPDDASVHKIYQLKQFDIEIEYSFLESEYHRIQRSKIKDDLWTFFVRMRFYKEKGNLLDSTNLLKEFELEFAKQKIPFNYWAYGISYNYLFNNVLSLELKKSNLSHLDIEGMLDRINSVQEKNRVYNYFPYKKLCVWLEQKIESDLNSEFKEDSIYSFFKCYQECIKKYRRNLDWSKNHLIWPYQPFIDECKVKTKETSILCVSSYNIPVNYEYEELKIKEFEESIIRFNNYFKTSRYLQREIEEFRKAKEGMHDALRKNIEILSIFAAIVLFTMGNIQIYSQIDTLNSAIAFTLAFGFVIAVFILLISIVVRGGEGKGNSIFKYGVFWILLVSVIVFICIILFAPNLPLNGKKKSESVSEKTQVDPIKPTDIDSVKINN